MSLVLSRHLTCREIVEIVTSYIEHDLDETDMVLFGRIRTGPFFALLRKEPAAVQAPARSAAPHTQA